MMFAIFMHAAMLLDIAAANPAEQPKVTLYFLPEYVFINGFEDQAPTETIDF